MNYLSPLLRIVCGAVLIILAISTYSRSAAAIASGGSLQVFGFAVGASGWQLTLSLAVIGLIGLVLVILGIANLLKARS